MECLNKNQSVLKSVTIIMLNQSSRQTTLGKRYFTFILTFMFLETFWLLLLNILCTGLKFEIVLSLCFLFFFLFFQALEAAKRFKAIQAWWQSMAKKDFKSISNPRNSSLEVFPISKSNNIHKRGSQQPNRYEQYRVTSQGCITSRHSLLPVVCGIRFFCFSKFFDIGSLNWLIVEIM